MWKFITDLFRKVTTPPAIPSNAKEMAAVEAEIETDVVEACGKLAMATLIELWKQNVYDPRVTDKTPDADRCRKIIDEIVRSERGAGWNWLDFYKGDGARGNPQWCGMTQGFAWHPWIDLETRRTWFPSTYRLDRWASYTALDEKHRNPRPAKGPFRTYHKLSEDSADLPAGYTPQVGDILLIGDGNPDYGDHVVGVIGYDEKRKMFKTIEGNGVGTLGNGKRGHGIVKAERPVGSRKPGDYHVRRIIRPAPGDLK